MEATGGSLPVFGLFTAKSWFQVSSQDENVKNSTTEHISSRTADVAPEQQMTQRSADKPEPPRGLPLTRSHDNHDNHHQALHN